ncbi:MAG: glycosyl hydrolase [Planctomycetota bacterium]
MHVDKIICAVVISSLAVVLASTPCAQAEQPSDLAQDLAQVEQQFRTLPMEARRLTGPLFWLHGDESPQRLKTYLDKVAEGGNGCFTAESRPHIDWLGPGWYRDLKICLEAARRLNLHMWIFDEKWWPSGEVGGEVPQQYGSKYMETTAEDVTGPRKLRTDVPQGDKLIAVLAGTVADGRVDGQSLVDLTDQAAKGSLEWSIPAGKWKVMVFTWRYSEGRGGRLLVDGASQKAVDWYIRTVYQPHYEHFPDAFGKTIRGYFYDEPETYGDWGTEVIPELKRRGVDWKRALVAWKFELANADEQVAAKYQYQDAFAEAWGRTLYGGLTDWCHDHDVLSIGHWLEHRREYLDPKKCAGNMFQVQKYSDMGGIDAVFKQFVPGRKDDNTYQTPKLGSSISHAYGKKDDLAMVEIFGARGQDLGYPEMKWWTDHMHVSGINFHIPTLSIREARTIAIAHRTFTTAATNLAGRCTATRTTRRGSACCFTVAGTCVPESAIVLIYVDFLMPNLW